MDIISDLGEIAFATRLKRLGERLAKDVSQLYRKLDIDFEARWFAILFSLARRSPMPVTGLAELLGISHTAVRQLVDEIAEKGLISWSKGKEDKRQQLVFLTRKSKEMIRQLSPVWKEIRSSTKELIESTGCDIIGCLNTVERKLDEQSMYERIWLRLRGTLPADIEICEYTPAMKKYFRELNYEWLKEYFTVEPGDEKILSDPNGKIIKGGGVILFARLHEEVVGTCALIKHRNGILEIAKMAVTKKYQGRGIGGKILRALIEKAKVSGATEVYLQTSAVLENANRLYRKYGFERTELNPFSGGAYNRKTIIMKHVIK